MSTPNDGNGTGPRVEPTPQNSESKPTTTTAKNSKAPSSYDVSSARRGVRSTRTPFGYDEPQRSQTVPVTGSSNMHIEPTAPAPRRRRPSDPSFVSHTPHATRQRTLSGEKHNPLGPDSAYIIEPLPSSSFPSHEHEQEQQEYVQNHQHEQQENQDSPYLIPPSMPVAMIDPRQSTSSFQTEPSSYYSFEDNWSSVGGRPPTVPMPEHHQGNVQQNMPSPNSHSQDSYGSTHPWLATPGPPMPTPVHEENRTSPSMPIPNLHPTPGAPSKRYPWNEEEEEEERNMGHATIRMPEQMSEPQPQPSSQGRLPLPQTTPSRPSRLRYGDPARPIGGVAPVIPPPPTTPPPLPSPGFGANHSWQSTFAQSQQTQANGGDGRPPGAAPPSAPHAQSTAPLRVQHHGRPTGPTGGAVSTAPTNAGRISAAQYTQPIVGKPENTTGNGQVKPGVVQYGSTTAPAGRFEGRPTVPSTTTPASGPQKPSAVSNAPPKPTSIYGQANANRVDSHQPTPALPAKTESVTASAPLKGRQETRPNAHIPTVTTVSNVSQKPSVTQAQSSGTRPGGSVAPIPSDTHHRPTISAPQPQQHASASAGPKPEAEKHNTKPPASSATVTASTPTRPRLHGAQSQMDTQYVNMLLALDDIPTLHNLFAGFFNWIVLAGFILFPGTFTSLQTLSAANGGQVPSELVNAVTQLPLYIVAWVCCAIGGFGMMWLWWRWRKNYIWALNRIFVPGLLNSLAGLLSTIVNVFAVQNGELSVTSTSTFVVTAAASGVFGILTLFYALWLVRRVKARHDREVGKQRAGQHGEGVVDLSKRRAR